MGCRKHAVMGAVVKLQQDLLGCALPLRPHGWMDYRGMLGNIAMEDSVVNSEFKIQNSKINFTPRATFFFFFRLYVILKKIVSLHT